MADFLQEDPSLKGLAFFHNGTLGRSRNSHCVGESLLPVTVPPCLCLYRATANKPILLHGEDPTFRDEHACLVFLLLQFITELSINRSCYLGVRFIVQTTVSVKLSLLEVSSR